MAVHDAKRSPQQTRTLPGSLPFGIDGVRRLPRTNARVRSSLLNSSRRGEGASGASS